MKLELQEISPQRGRDGGDDLGNQPVQIGVGWPSDLQIVLAKVVDRLQGYLCHIIWLVFSSISKTLDLVVN